MPFQIIRNDITKVKADAIVNTANPDVAIGNGVDNAIYNAAGMDRLFAERKKIGPLEPGMVAATPAFDLDAKIIIHAIGTWWEGGDKGEAEILRQCYDKSLKLAADYKCKSIAFPLLATGCYGFPQKLGMEIAVDSFTRFLEENEMEIYLVVFNQSAVRISGELGEEVRSLIDDDYADAAMEAEYSYGGYDNAAAGPEPHHQASPSGKSRWIDRLLYSRSLKDEDSKYDKPKAPAPKNVRPTAPAPEAPEIAGAAAPEASKPAGVPEPKAQKLVGAAAPVVYSSASLDDVLKDIYTDSFEKHLQKLINKKGLKNSEVYAAANINKQYFSKLLKGKVKPSKEKVLALAVGLRLNMDEAVDFLGLAGYALSPISQTDAVVRYFIEHENYSVMKIDMVLFDYGLDPLSKETK
ncbi:macro domain-containing protein [Butyrivibrio sp. FCS014]|uniref:macro domain-containing protein n=1 Tax=Butyrivibrio sp. FCS014 TaxID=1408304 RepID=UPI0004650A59|nr:macro domain-containing protein [Butyrivibrio sp. FCS014]